MKMGDTYVVTGGMAFKTGQTVPSFLQTAIQYTVTGEVTDMPEMQQGRYNHACSSFKDSGGVTVSLTQSIYYISNSYYDIDTASIRRLGRYRNWHFFH